MYEINPGDFFKPSGPGVAHLAVPDDKTRVRSKCGKIRSLLPTDKKAAASDARCEACVPPAVPSDG